MNEVDISQLVDEVRRLREEVQGVRADLKAYLEQPEDKDAQNLLTELHTAVGKIEDCRKLLKGPTYM